MLVMNELGKITVAVQCEKTPDHLRPKLHRVQNKVVFGTIYNTRNGATVWLGCWDKETGKDMTGAGRHLII